MTYKEDFTRLYIQEIIVDKGLMSEELTSLFDLVLINEFDENPILMDEFIKNIVTTNTPRTISSEERLSILEQALIEVLNMELGGVTGE